jgi:hypothetical protein
MAKGSPCSCGKCNTRLNCTQGEIVGGAGAINGGAQCCTCVPTRICMSLVFDDYDSRRVTVPIDCVTGAYFGVWQINSQALIIRFEMYLDVEGNCWAMLSSDQLGLTLTEAYDNRLYVPLAGSFDDQYSAALRRSTCLNPDYDFDLDLSPLGAGSVTLQIRRAAYVASRQADRNWQIDPYKCMCQCACISIEFPDGSVVRETVCLNESNQWVAEFDPLDNNFVIITKESGSDEPTLLSMQSSIGDGDIIPAECGCMTNMTAQWNTSYGRVKITCSNQGCIDCNCWCRDLCITYQNDTERIIKFATWDEELELWQVDVAGEDAEESQLITVSKQCNAATGVTQLRMTSHFGNGDAVDIDCPQISAAWSLQDYSGVPFVITAECAVCGDCPEPGDLEPCGCYDFIPETLYATFSPAATVPPDPPETPGQNAACTGAGGVIVLRALRAAGAVIGWFGCGYPFAGCPDLRVCLEMRCVEPLANAAGLQLTITYDGDSAGDLFPDESSCEPYSGSWLGINKDPICCQSEGTVENLYDIHITE